MLKIKVHGAIVPKACLWCGEDEDSVFNVDFLRKAFAEHPEEREVVLDIDCAGGDVEEGFKIYDELRNSGRVIYANINGSCHSMAVVVLLAAPYENRSANRNCRALIHKVYAPSWDWLNEADAQSMADMLRLEEQAILDIYADRTGADRERLQEVMNEEKMHDARSLQALGFVSKINPYSTNQFFNFFTKMAKKNEQANSATYASFMAKVNGLFRKSGKAVNFDYFDAEGNVVLTTPGEEDDLAVGVEAFLSTGEASGEVTLEDGRVVAVVDNIVTEITESEEEEPIEERVKALETALEEATNLIREQQTTINSLRAELGNRTASNYQPKGRTTVVPGNSGNEDKSKENLKAIARQKQDKVNLAVKTFGRK